MHAHAKKSLTAIVAAAATLMLAPMTSAEVTLKASHQWPEGDVRDEMVRIIKKEAEAADVGLNVRIYTSASLFKPKEQWDPLTKGTLDISAFPLDYASGRHPQFSATLMPGLVKNHEHARRLNDSAYMDEIREIINDAGVMVLSDAWLAGGFVGKGFCVTEPSTAQGKVMRAAGPYFERMLAAAGASINSMPSSEIYTALQTGVLDGANTSSGSFVSYRIYEQATCLTPPGDYALWFMYEPILMSQRSWERLNDEQRAALRAAGEKAEEFFFGEAKKLDRTLVETYEKAGVEVVDMTEAQYNAWLGIAKKSSYAHFADNVPGGKEILDKALAVE
ncbi:MAG: ABC transporter substrate-binding protein [Gammaproteobacteria bacterium]|nr:ABC transporter substrate-binding protein [Gammaproteobacteria bacterium]NIR85009.1 ABC transporter substrate-binding protein [Gammaproteobacteria bacterium]NIR88276.1 ABC transporter substrate-binding protein [Gammaproteobacteria bacterium]NIU06056.1 ABC transporter substrate-binding protein [Gammaproteobacteria bacterium]NIV73475.1 ABC transporter substrate-binding protein [Gammaproteobacteria bacterium]